MVDLVGDEQGPAKRDTWRNVRHGKRYLTDFEQVGR